MSRMSNMSTGGRRGVAAAFVAVMISTAACGTQTGTDPAESAPRAPGAFQPKFHTSPDAIERRDRAAQQGTPTSADAAERRGQDEFPPAPAGKRVPD